MTRSGIIPETLLPTNLISLTMDMQDGLSCISSMVSSILCGKRPSIGYWELCPTIRVNWHTSQVSVSASYHSCFPFKHVSPQISQFSQPALQVPGVLTPKRHRTPSFFDKIDVAFWDTYPGTWPCSFLHGFSSHRAWSLRYLLSICALRIIHTPPMIFRACFFPSLARTINFEYWIFNCRPQSSDHEDRESWFMCYSLLFPTVHI